MLKLTKAVTAAFCSAQGCVWPVNAVRLRDWMCSLLRRAHATCHSFVLLCLATPILPNLANPVIQTRLNHVGKYDHSSFVWMAKLHIPSGYSTHLTMAEHGFYQRSNV